MSASALLIALSVAASDPRLLVLDASVSGDVERTDVTAVERLVLQSLNDAVEGGLQVVAVSDLTRLVELQAERQLADCADEGCLAEVAAAMGAERLVTLELSRLGTDVLLQMTLVDQGGARVRSRQTLRGRSLDELTRGLPVAARELLSPLTEDEKLVLAEVAASPGRGLSPLTLAGGATLGVGALVGVVGGVGLTVAVANAQNRNSPFAVRDAWQDSGPWWLGATAVGALGVVAGGGLLVLGVLE